MVQRPNIDTLSSRISSKSWVDSPGFQEECLSKMEHVITLPSSDLLEIRRIPKFLSVWYTILLRLGNTSDPFYSERTSVHSQKPRTWQNPGKNACLIYHKVDRDGSFCGRPPWGLGVERFHVRGMMSSSGRKEYMQYLVKPGKEISGAYRMSEFLYGAKVDLSDVLWCPFTNLPGTGAPHLGYESSIPLL